MKTEIFNTIEKAREDYRTFIKANCTEENAKLILKEIMEKYELDFITFVGYTPYFNDGEPCEHSSYTVTDKGENADHFNFDEFDGADYEDHDYKLHVENPDFKYNEKVDAWDWRENREDLNKMNSELEVVEFILEQLYETNYKVFAFVNKDDEIALVHEDYYDY